MSFWIQFSIGIILGILVAMSMIQNDLFGRVQTVFTGENHPSNNNPLHSTNLLKTLGSITTSSSTPSESQKKSLMKDNIEGLAVIQKTSEQTEERIPSIPSQQEQTSTTSTSASTTKTIINTPADTQTAKQQKKPLPIKWAPGKEMNFQKFIQQAESVQKDIFGADATSSKQQPISRGREGPTSDTISVAEDMPSSPLGRKKSGGGKQRRNKDPMASTMRKESRNFITAINTTEEPIELENQLKLYKKLKRKEGMFVGDNDEDPTAAIVNAADAATEAAASSLEKGRGAGGGKRQKGSKQSNGDSSVPVSSVTNVSTVVILTNGIGVPPISYHEQVYQDFSKLKPLIPTYEDALKKSLPLPDMTKQKGAFERQNLKIHLCNGVFEAYSASYLTTKEHMIAVASESFNLTWVNCEMASFIHMKESNRFYQSPDHHGVVMQSLDILDFSVIHLSAFERSSLKHKNIIWDNERDRRRQWSNIDPVVTAGKQLELLNNPKKRPSHRKIVYSPEAIATVVIMPFLGGAMGAGHSKLGNRFEYLKTCFWSLYEFFPNIVISVTRQEDVDWGWKESGLPFYDILLIPGLPKSASLPVATTQQTKMRLKPGGLWEHFQYVFFSESDQILISRELPLMYHHLKQYPGHMMLPHRLMPYSPLAITKAHLRDVTASVENTWMNQSCCLPRQNCVERSNWKSVKDPIVPMMNYYGLYIPLGNINFLREEYRYCTLTPYIGDYCP